MGDFAVFIKEIMETARGIPAEVPAGHHNDIHKIAGFYGDNVGGCSPVRCRKRIFAVYVIVKVAVVSAPEIIEIKASGSAVYHFGNFVCASVAIFFVGIKVKVQSGDILFAVCVIVDYVFLKPEIRKFYAFKLGHFYRNTSHNRSVFAVNEFVVKAYGKIDVFFRKYRYREHSNGHNHRKEKR